MISAIALLAAIIAIAAYLTYSLDKKDEELPAVPPFTEEELKSIKLAQEELDNIKLATELYNKDLRPIVARKAKRKPAPELEVIEPEFVAKVIETAKVFPPDATINVEALVTVKESKPEFPIDKPVKKKRKYYPKKK